MATKAEQKLSRAFRKAKPKQSTTAVEAKLEQIENVVSNPQLLSSVESGDLTPHGFVSTLRVMVTAVRESDVKQCPKSIQYQIIDAIDATRSPIDVAPHFRPFGAEQAVQAIETMHGLEGLVRDFESQMTGLRRASRNFVDASREASRSISTSLEQGATASND